MLTIYKESLMAYLKENPSRYLYIDESNLEEMCQDTSTIIDLRIPGNHFGYDCEILYKLVHDVKGDVFEFYGAIPREGTSYTVFNVDIRVGFIPPAQYDSVVLDIIWKKQSIIKHHDYLEYCDQKGIEARSWSYYDTYFKDPDVDVPAIINELTNNGLPCSEFNYQASVKQFYDELPF